MINLHEKTELTFKEELQKAAKLCKIVDLKMEGVEPYCPDP